MGIDLSAFVDRIPELTSAAALLHPGPNMSTPQKRKAEDAPEGETGSKRAYNVFEWQEYTPEVRFKPILGFAAAAHACTGRSGGDGIFWRPSRAARDEAGRFEPGGHQDGDQD